MQSNSICEFQYIFKISETHILRIRYNKNFFSLFLVSWVKKKLWERYRMWTRDLNQTSLLTFMAQKHIGLGQTMEIMHHKAIVDQYWSSVHAQNLVNLPRVACGQFRYRLRSVGVVPLTQPWASSVTDHRSTLLTNGRSTDSPDT